MLKLPSRDDDKNVTNFHMEKLKNGGYAPLHVRFSFFVHFAAILVLSTKKENYEALEEKFSFFFYLQITDTNLIPG